MMLRVVLGLFCVLEALLVQGLPFQKTDISILRRKTRSTDGMIGCMHMASFPGELTYHSDGTPEVCGLYLIGEPDQIVEVEFLNFNIMCADGGLAAFFDGWELQGDIFPGMDDHTLSMHDRYTTFCDNKPKKLFVSSQNVALIQFRVPTVGEGFKVLVNFKSNPQPCNAVAMFEMGVLTMKNFGMRRNCTVSIIFPEKIKFLNVDVGVTAEKKVTETEVGLTDKQCMHFGGGDYIQLLYGNGLDTSVMATRAIYCGMESRTDKTVKVVLGCNHSVVRMVSSGDYYNTVTFEYAPPSEDEIPQTQSVC